MGFDAMPWPRPMCEYVTSCHQDDTKAQQTQQFETVSTATGSGIVSEDSRGLDVPYVIRNTFVEYPATRPPSLQEFLLERLSKSAPGSHIEEVPNDMPVMGESASTSAPVPTCNPCTVDLGNARFAEVLSLQGSLGTAQLPTIGSQGHAHGRCRPCAFHWSEEGCGNGVACAFCHLCDYGEKKRRKKEKKRVRAMAKLQRALFGMSKPF